jgi:uncharacterized protein (DUF849 family)
MPESSKVIISCAITGAIHTPSMSPYLPVTPEQIAESAIGAAEAGAAIVHLHARDPETGRPDQSPEAFGRFLPVIKKRSNCIVNITTGGAPWMTVQERAKPVAVFKPELASLNMGSMNFGLFPMLNRYKEFKHAWERETLEASRDFIFRNTFKDVECILQICSETGTRFEFECYDTGHIYNLAYFLDRGLVKPPLFVQTVFGILGGIGTHPEDLMHLKRTADRVLGDAYRWSVLGAGMSRLLLKLVRRASPSCELTQRLRLAQEWTGFCAWLDAQRARLGAPTAAYEPSIAGSLWSPPASRLRSSAAPSTHRASV